MTCSSLAGGIHIKERTLFIIQQECWRTCHGFHQNCIKNTVNWIFILKYLVFYLRTHWDSDLTWKNFEHCQTKFGNPFSWREFNLKKNTKSQKLAKYQQITWLITCIALHLDLINAGIKHWIKYWAFDLPLWSSVSYHCPFNPDRFRSLIFCQLSLSL